MSISDSFAKRLETAKGDLRADWVLVLAGIVTASGAYSNLKNFGSVSNLDTNDWLAIFIDLLVTAIVSTSLFAVLPNSIRRRRVRKRIEETNPQEPRPVGSFLGAMMVVAVIAAGFGLANNTQNDVATDFGIVGSRQNRCEASGEDEVCIEVVYLGMNAISMEQAWKYSTERVISGQSVSKIVWKARIDCNSKVGTLEDMTFYNYLNSVVVLEDSITAPMLQGVQTNQVDPMVVKTCADNK